MHEAQASEAEMFAAGLRPEDFESEAFEVWPENMRAINLFNTLSTQWIVGSAGPTGLNYTPLFHRMDRMSLDAQEYEWLFDDIRTIEAEALTAMNKKD